MLSGVRSTPSITMVKSLFCGGCCASKFSLKLRINSPAVFTALPVKIGAVVSSLGGIIPVTSISSCAWLPAKSDTIIFIISLFSNGRVKVISVLPLIAVPLPITWLCASVIIIVPTSFDVTSTCVASFTSALMSGAVKSGTMIDSSARLPASSTTPTVIVSPSITGLVRMISTVPSDPVIPLPMISPFSFFITTSAPASSLFTVMLFSSLISISMVGAVTSPTKTFSWLVFPAWSVTLTFISSLSCNGRVKVISVLPLIAVPLPITWPCASVIIIVPASFDVTSTCVASFTLAWISGADVSIGFDSPLSLLLLFELVAAIVPATNAPPAIHASIGIASPFDKGCSFKNSSKLSIAR